MNSDVEAYEQHLVESLARITMPDVRRFDCDPAEAWRRHLAQVRLYTEAIRKLGYLEGAEATFKQLCGPSRMIIPVGDAQYFGLLAMQHLRPDASPENVTPPS